MNSKILIIAIAIAVIATVFMGSANDKKQIQQIKQKAKQAVQLARREKRLTRSVTTSVREQMTLPTV